MLRAVEDLKLTLMEYVFGYDVTGDGYLWDVEVRFFDNLHDLFSSTNGEQVKYLEDRYPGARKRYMQLMASPDLKALLYIELGVSALVKRKPVVPELSIAEFVAAVPALLGDDADPSCITALYAMADAAPTTEGFYRKRRNGRTV